MKKFITTKLAGGFTLAALNVATVVAAAPQQSGGSVLGTSTDAELSNTGTGTLVSIFVGAAIILAVAMISRRARTQN